VNKKRDRACVRSIERELESLERAKGVHHPVRDNFEDEMAVVLDLVWRE
jgi:hypothetical protein